MLPPSEWTVARIAAALRAAGWPVTGDPPWRCGAVTVCVAPAVWGPRQAAAWARQAPVLVLCVRLPVQAAWWTRWPPGMAVWWLGPHGPVPVGEGSA